MADTFIQLNTDGTGKKLDTRTEATNGEHRQVFVLGDPATNAGVAPVDGTKGLAVDLSATGANTNKLLVTPDLPSGASTAAKQPALGTAGSASADVITVQGITSMTALKVDGSAVTQPISGSVTANIGTSGSLALDATLTGGTQKSKITNGVQEADTVAGDSGQNSLAVVGAEKEVTYTTTIAAAVASTDVRNYAFVSVHSVTQGTSSTVTFQTSNDNVNWVSMSLLTTSVNGGASISTTSASIMLYGAVPGRYFRLNVTGISAGTTAGTVEFFANAKAMHSANISAVQSGTWTVGSNSATGSAVPANAYYVAGNSGGNLTGISVTTGGSDTMGTTNAGLFVVDYNALFNGTNWDRYRGGAQSNVAAATGYAAALGIAQYNAAAPTITDTRYNHLQLDVNANLKTALGSLIAGENLTSNRLNVEPIYSYATITTATTTTVKSGAGTLSKIMVTGGTTGTIVIWDSLTATGTKIADFDTTNALATYEFNASFSTGLTIVTSAATKITVLYR